MEIREESLKRIIERIGKEGRIYCYGAGKFGRWFSEDPIGRFLWDYVENYIDSSPEKQGNVIGINGNNKKIISLKDLMDKIKPHDAIVITCKDYIPIIDLLNGCEKLENTSCYVFSMLKGYLEDDIKLEEYCPDKLVLSEEQLIPKVIHYCWFGGGELSEKHLKCITSWKKLCPDYEIVRWDESNYDWKKLAFMEQAYRYKKWAYVSDYARLDIVNKYGGIYLDTDVEVVKKLDDLLFQNSFCGFQNEKEVNFGLGFGSVANNIILKTIMSEYENMQFVCEDNQINLTPCPIIQTKVLDFMGLKTDGQYQIINGMTVYPERVLCGKSQRTRRIHLTDKTYAVHHFDASWMEQDDILHRRTRDKEVDLYEKYMENGKKFNA